MTLLLSFFFVVVGPSFMNHFPFCKYYYVSDYSISFFIYSSIETRYRSFLFELALSHSKKINTFHISSQAI